MPILYKSRLIFVTHILIPIVSDILDPAQSNGCPWAEVTYQILVLVQ